MHTNSCVNYYGIAGVNLIHIIEYRSMGIYRWSTAMLQSDLVVIVNLLRLNSSKNHYLVSIHMSTNPCSLWSLQIIPTIQFMSTCSMGETCRQSSQNRCTPHAMIHKCCGGLETKLTSAGGQWPETSVWRVDLRLFLVGLGLESRISPKPQEWDYSIWKLNSGDCGVIQTVKCYTGQVFMI